MISPFLLILIAETPSLLKPEPVTKLSSLVPSSFNRIILFATVVLKIVKLPPKTIFPSGCKAMALTSSLKPVPLLKVESKVPLAFNRIIRLAETPLNTVKLPVRSIFWSDKTFACVIFNADPEPVRKVESSVPFGNKRATLFTVLLLYFVKLPTIIISPSGCKAIS
ncbi:hypothetical protein D3C80_1398890 [compost metagenome]